VSKEKNDGRKKEESHYMTILITLFPYERGEKNTTERKRYICYRNIQCIFSDRNSFGVFFLLEKLLEK